MDQATTISLARIAIGAAAWANPELGLKSAMLDPESPQSPYLLRLFGARDVALGAITLFAKPEHKPALLRVGLAVDGADGAAAVLALQKKAVEPIAGAVLAGAAGLAIVAGFIALGQQRKAP